MIPIIPPAAQKVSLKTDIDETKERSVQIIQLVDLVIQVVYEWIEQFGNIANLSKCHENILM